MLHDSSEGQTTGLVSPYLERVRCSQVAGEIRAGQSILDIGCGRAPLLKMLIKQGKTPSNYTGMDLLPDVIEANKQQFPDYNFVVTNITATDQLSAMPDWGAYDTIAMLAILEHLEEPDEIFTTLKYGLAEGGRILLTTPSRGAEGIHAFGARLGLFSREAMEEHNDSFPNLDSVKQLAQQSGYTVSKYRRFLFGFNQLIELKPIT